MSSNDIFEYMNFLIPNPHCEFNYNKDYELLIATMLSAQTTDKRVNMVCSVLFDKYDSLDKLASADIEDIKVIIRSLGSYNKKASNIISISKKLIDYSNGKVINDRAFLESLPGVGRKTCNVVLGELFDGNFIAVDTHVKRVSVRLGIALETDDVRVIEEKLYKFFDGYSFCNLRHQLVLFGRYYCKAINPKCNGCKFNGLCNKKN